MAKEAKDSRLDQWRKLLRAVRETESDLAGVAPFREALEAAYTRALFNRRTRDSMLASAREASQRLHESAAAGNDAAIALRNYIKSVIGTRVDELFRYGMKPRRNYRRRGKPTPGSELPS